MTTRTFQQIYDFCRTDDTYRAYFQIPDELHTPDRRKRQYYYGNIRDGRCRLKTFIYSQSMRQLERFLGGAKQDYYIHLDTLTCREVSLNDEMPLHSTIYVVVHIREHGVRFEIEHPLHKGWVHFTPRSHRPFTGIGIIAEAKAYIDRHVLLAPGRYRDLQMKYMVPTKKFPEWYRKYKEDLHFRAELEHWDLVDKYRHRNDLTYEEARNILAVSDIFSDLNCDEFERNEMTEEFVKRYNRT